MARRTAGPSSRQQLDAGRLNRYIARAGVCSRRKADALIASGQVKVNGNVCRDYWLQVDYGDEVKVGGRVISPRPFAYLLLNKPKDTITTSMDERGRKTVLDLIDKPEETDGVFTVGRLDRDTTGVLILTSDGELGYRLMHPRYRVPKRYFVRTQNPVRPHELEHLRSGVQLDDGRAAADQLAYAHPQNHCVIGIEIHEGRNRQLRRMFAALNHEIVALERVAYAGLTASGVRRGKWRRLREREIVQLRRLVHLK